MGAFCIQIVEGNPHLRSLLGWHLQQAGYIVHQSADLHQAREVYLQRQPTLVILDSELPDGDGLEFCRWLHQQQQSMAFNVVGSQFRIRYCGRSTCWCR
ncbi:response regulator transcription factor [Kovacikia minuta]|uniref:response regulator transcription factor n=1 Tax=Kovacikia minuta TaxID=2931930 RepID=UPI0036F24BAC